MFSIATGAVNAAENLPRPTFLGFAPAYPVEEMSLDRKTAVLNLAYDSLVWATLLVGSDGHPDGIVSDSLYDSSVVSHLMQFFEPMKFVPATLNGEEVASKLRIHTRIRPKGLAPMVQWPIDSDRRVVDQTLYALTLRLNDIMPPTLRTFPSYHGNITRKDSIAVYPYVLTRVDLDSTGVPANITPLRSTYPGFDQLVYTACNWAEYNPAKIRGRAVSATVYVLVSFFSTVSYPTSPLDFSQSTELPLREACRVRTLYDTLGPLAPAIPVFIADDSLLMQGNPGITTGTGSVLCLIDSTGRARAARVSVTSPLQPRFQRLVSQLQYYPALDHEGNPVGFAGPLRLQFSGSEYVRISVLWLASNNRGLLE
jgi:hypothetical protein